MDYTYTYKQMATTLDRSERTIGRWLAALRKKYPGEKMTTDKGRITEDGVNRLYQYREEVAAGISSEEGIEEESPGAITQYLEGSVELPNFQEIGQELRSRLQQMMEQDELLARQLGYEATVQALGTGLYKGRQEAMREVMGQTAL